MILQLLGQLVLGVHASLLRVYSYGADVTLFMITQQEAACGKACCARVYVWMVRVRCTRIPLSVCLRCGVERRAGGGVTAPVLFIQNYYSTYYGTTNSYYVLEYYRTT